MLAASKAAVPSRPTSLPAVPLLAVAVDLASLPVLLPAAVVQPRLISHQLAAAVLLLELLARTSLPLRPVLAWLLSAVAELPLLLLRLEVLRP